MIHGVTERIRSWGKSGYALALSNPFVNYSRRLYVTKSNNKRYTSFAFVSLLQNKNTVSMNQH